MYNNTHLDPHAGQLTPSLGPPAQSTERGQHEDVERDEGRRGVARECKHRYVRTGRRDRREGGRLAWLDLDAAEVDRTAEVPLNDGLEQVARAHGRAARREHEVGLLETFLQRCDVRFQTGALQ